MAQQVVQSNQVDADYVILSPEDQKVLELLEAAGITARQVLLVGEFLKWIELPWDMDSYAEYTLQYLFNGQGLGYFHLLTPVAQLDIISRITNTLPQLGQQPCEELIGELGDSLLLMTRAVNSLVKNDKDGKFAGTLTEAKISLKPIYYKIDLPGRYPYLEP